jgi:ribosomal protein S18 acetylase RimI-like enzyme
MVEPHGKEILKVTVERLVEEDINLLEPILRQHVRDLYTHEVVEAEVLAIQDYMRGIVDSSGRVRHYLVAHSENQKAIGCMAISIPDVDMTEHFGTDAVESAELLNIFVDTNYLGGKGVGKALFEAACVYASSYGMRYLLVNSGPRYRSSWGFYDRVCDSSHGFIQHKYGAGRHAKTWKKRLQDQERRLNSNVNVRLGPIPTADG